MLLIPAAITSDSLSMVGAYVWGKHAEINIYLIAYAHAWGKHAEVNR